MARLTRTESRNRNREMLLAAAREHFLARGYLAASLATIADAAGFSTGVVYSNVSGKAELALAVLEEIQEEQFEALGQALAAGSSPDEKLAGLHAWAERAQDSGWPLLELEFALEARNSPTMTTREGLRHISAAASVAAVLKDLIDPKVAELVPVEVMVEAAMNMAYGVAVRHIVDPAVTAEQMIQPLRDLLRLLAVAPSA
jgi:AcrR family transcriptional regulator